jgi:hypothetical protein
VEEGGQIKVAEEEEGLGGEGMKEERERGREGGSLGACRGGGGRTEQTSGRGGRKV